MELLQLKYFQHVATYGNMTRAAEALHISQPSLSIMISRLEAELGVKLFDRKGRGIVLNEYGKIMLEHTNTALYELNKATYVIEELKEKQGRQIHLCMNGQFFHTGFIKSFCKRYTQYHMRQKNCSHLEAESLLLRGDCHFALTMPLLEHEQIETIPLYEEKLVCYMSKQHPLANQEGVLLQDLANEDFVSPYRSDAAVWQSKSYFTKKFGFSPNFIFEGEKEIAQELVTENKGIMFSLLSQDYMFDSEKVVAVPVKDSSIPVIVGLSWLKDKELNIASLAFLEYVKRYFSVEDVLHQ